MIMYIIIYKSRGHDYISDLQTGYTVMFLTKL